MSTHPGPALDSVVIIGAGVCGLAVAMRLLERRPGLDVTILEGEREAGGLARSLTLDGLVSDLGPHRLFTELDDVKALLDELAGPDLAKVERRSRMWLRGRWIEYPPKPLEVIGALGPVTVGMAGVSWAMEKVAAVMPRAGRVDHFENAMTAAFGGTLYRAIVRDYTRKVWKCDPRKLHGDIARARVSAGGLARMVKRVLGGDREGTQTALKHFYMLPGGAAGLVERLRARVEALGARVVLGARVGDLTQRGGDSWLVNFTHHGESLRMDADRVVSTIPLKALAGMMLAHKPHGAAADARRGLRCIGNFLVTLATTRPRVSDCQWHYFPGADTIFNRGYEPGNFHPSLGATSDARGGRSLLMLEVTALPGTPLWKITDGELIARCLDDLEPLGMVARREVAASSVHRIADCYPLYDMDYRRRTGSVLKYLAGFAGLVSTGRQGLFLHNNMDHSIHMGFRAAEALLGESAADAPRVHYDELDRFRQFRIVD